MTVKDIFALRKQGKIEEAYEWIFPQIIPQNLSMRDKPRSSTASRLIPG
jgi:hypothetical protein